MELCSRGIDSDAGQCCGSKTRLIENPANFSTVPPPCSNHRNPVNLHLPSFPLHSFFSSTLDSSAGNFRSDGHHCRCPPKLRTHAQPAIQRVGLIPSPPHALPRIWTAWRAALQLGSAATDGRRG
ncbi:unnamed protein product [Urochloa humidicola]